MILLWKMLLQTFAEVQAALHGEDICVLFLSSLVSTGRVTGRL